MRNSKDYMYLPTFYMYSQHEQVRSFVVLTKLIHVTRSSIHIAGLAGPFAQLDVAAASTAWLDGVTVEAAQLEAKEHIKVLVYFL